MTKRICRIMLEYRSGDEILKALRRAVWESRQTNPELGSCSLADVGLTRNRAMVNVTLYFQKDP
ncbi:MAG: hypothetical protein GX335_05150 [Firmicutes bacterium]|nr:hypothetical protein [Bacillota bacterium]